MRVSRLLRNILAVCVLGLFLVPAANAQDESASDTASSDFTDEEVESVAAAVAAIQDLQRQYQKEHGNPANLDSSEVAQIRKEFQSERQQAIKDEGISQSTFGEVLQAAQSDTALQSQLYSEIEEAGGQTPNTQGPQGRQGGGAQQVPDVSASQIQKAGQAFAQIQQVRQRYRSQFGNVQDSTKQQQIQRKYQMATQKAIQSAGLTPMQFSQVVKAAKADPKVRKQFFSAIQQAGGQPPRPRRQAPSQGQQQPAPSPAPSPGPGN